MHQLRLTLVLIFALLMIAPFAIAQELPPYLYYYSNPELAFRVERADGTDSHLMLAGFISAEDNTGLIRGPGWSPDGEWFSWQLGAVSQTFITKPGYIVRIDGSEGLDALNALLGVSRIQWSPSSNYVLVSGYVQPCSENGWCPYSHYWLIDVQQNTLLATYELRWGAGSYGDGYVPVEWRLEDGQVIFYALEEVLTTMAFPNYQRITMNFDGVVLVEPITHEEYLTLAEPLPELPDVDSVAVYGNLAFSSPSGRYTITPAAGILTDTQTGEQVTLPAPDFFEGEFDLRMNAAVWHPSEEWVLLGYDGLGGTNRVSVFKVDGSVYRELAECGGIGDACVGWLPENVDVSRIPAGRLVR